MKDLRDLKVLAIHDVKPLSDELRKRAGYLDAQDVDARGIRVLRLLLFRVQGFGFMAFGLGFRFPG